MINSVGYRNLVKAFDRMANCSGEMHAVLGSMRMWSIDNAVYIPTFFRPEELVPREAFKAFGDQSFSLMDARILWTADAIREWFGKPVKVNNWHSGGSLEQRGFRLQPINAKFSPHLYGRAIDFNVEGVSDEEVQHRIRINFGKESALRFVTRMEENTSGWTHVDCVNTGKDELTIFKGA